MDKQSKYLTSYWSLAQFTGVTDIKRKKRPPLMDLVELRKAKFPGKRVEFAASLGIVAAHLLSIERGRRTPSPALAARWIEALGPPAELAMFGPLPELEIAIKAAKHVARIEPGYYEAA